MMNPKKEDLRPVTVTIKDGADIRTIDGWFHGYVEYSSDDGANNWAIIELTNGQLQEYYIPAIRFTDRCKICKGRGKVIDDQKSKECIVCAGNGGWVESDISKDGVPVDVTCEDCGGTGHIIRYKDCECKGR